MATDDERADFGVGVHEHRVIGQPVADLAFGFLAAAGTVGEEGVFLERV